MAPVSQLKAELASLSLGEKLRMLFWLAERHPGAVRHALDAREPKSSVVILSWHIGEQDPEGMAAEPDPPAALG